MKRFLKKPFWIGASAVLATAATVTPAITLSSCSAIEHFMIDEIDHETGTDSVMYDTMKKEFRQKYITKLRTEEFMKDDEIAEKLVDFDDYLQKQDNMLTKNEEGAIVADYTSMTVALSEYASTQYGIHLNRRCNIDWPDFANQYRGLRNATKTFMVNHEIDPIDAEKMLKDCDNRFDDLQRKLAKEYEYDPLLGVIKGQNELLTLFDENNAEVALVASMNRLSDFTSKYTFEFNSNASESCYYDNLRRSLPDPTIKPVDISGIMNDVFVCKEVQSGNIKDFDNKMLPGYILTPYLVGWYEDAYSNQYGMEIDWQIYPSAYDNSDLSIYKPLVTAHVYGENKKIGSGEIEEDTPFNETILQSEVLTTRYFLQATAEYEKTNLKRTYFNTEANSDYVRLEWQGGAKNEKNKYEAFFDGIPENHDSGTLKADSLAYSGLRISSNGISYEDLSEVIARIDAERARPEDARPDEELSLAEKFVKYCTIKSNVTVEESYSAGHGVYHYFYYWYSNSVKGDAGIYYEEEPRRSDGFLISKEFFTIANERYCEAYDLYQRYSQLKDFVDIKKNCNALIAGFVSTTAMTAVQIAKNVVKMFFAGIAGKLIAAYTIGLLTSNAVFLGIIWPVYENYLVDPIDDFIDNIKKMRNDPCYLKMQARLTNDHQYFCVPNENGKYPYTEYTDKEEAFRTAPFVSHSRPLFQYYSTLMTQQDFLDFKNLTVKYHVDPKSFKRDFGTWMYTGECYIACYGYAGIRALLNQLLMPEIPSSWAQFIIEFELETWLGMVITKVLEDTVYNYEYKE